MPRGLREIDPRTKEYYLKNYQNLSQDERDKMRSEYNKKRNVNCIEYWIEKYPDKNIDELQKLKTEHLKARDEKHRCKLSYWIKQNPDKTEDECRELMSDWMKSNNFQNIEFYNKRYPHLTQEERQVLLEKAKADYNERRPNYSGENNPGHRSKTTVEERRLRSPLCWEFWKSKHPDKTQEECEALVLDHKALMKSKHTPENTCTCVEYWLTRGYTLEEASEKIKHPFSLQKCIEKYGVEEGTLRFEQRQEKWQKSLRKSMITGGRGGTRSRTQMRLGEAIREHISIGYEFPLSRYSFDFYYGKKFIEFNGDYWHCNPDMYAADYYNKVNKKTAREIWERDAIKYKTAEEAGYEVMVIWEKELREDFEACVMKCVNYLKS